jgi:hypothetical protein
MVQGTVPYDGARQVWALVPEQETTPVAGPGSSGDGLNAGA